MVDAIHAGQAAVAVSVRRGNEPRRLQRQLCGRTRSAKLDFFVVQDIFFSATCQFADVVLPACPSLEKEGTFTSTERRMQRLYQVSNRCREAGPIG